MPPSPSLRRSPSMEPRGDSHKRGRSLESGLSFRQKDDDLALFNEMQSKETENFLLQPSDDLEDIFSSRVKPFPDLKLGIIIPSRGESTSSDLLNADGDKNDYEWLLTPPDTPLFPSLDDEPAPDILVHNGRARSRPISISRSSTMEKSHRSSRGSPSPQRLSPSPRSGSGTFRGRPTSAPHQSPVPLRPSTPSRRPSPPPVKPSTPPPRSLTPTSRRTTSGVTSGLRGTSPVRTSRGNSASPKVKAWQSNIPGFSLEAPPNLRTSLADRPASYVRGSSPASRTSKDSSSRPGRQSMSPTATRSISSSHSQERDRQSSHSKGSVASSGDDDADSLQSFPTSVSERPMSRRGVSGSYSRPIAFSKKPTKTFSPSSAPKRSFDSAMRQMERKSPQNMFRPLLSSVPSSTFYAGNVSVAHRTMTSRNSSHTTSSNASSDQATSMAHDTEGSDQFQDDMASDCARSHFADIQDEVFVFDKMDVAIEDTAYEEHDVLPEVQLGEPDKSCAFASNAGDSEGSTFHVCAMPTDAASEAVDVQDDFVELGSHENSLRCSRCGCQYHVDEMIESEDNICPECKQKNELSTSAASLIRFDTTLSTSVPLLNTFEESKITEPILAVPHLQNPVDIADPRNIPETTLREENKHEGPGHDSLPRQSCLDNSLPMSMGEKSVQSEQQVTEEQRTDSIPSHNANDLQEMHKCSDKSDPRIDVGEGAGISVLLFKRTSSVKGPLVHGRSLNSSAISYDDLSYARDLTSSMRSSTGHGSISASSSIDLASARHGEMLLQRKSNGRRSDTSSKPQSTASSCSGTSMQVYQGLGASTSSHDENYEGSVSNMRHIVAGETPGSHPDQRVGLENVELRDAISSVSGAVQSVEADNDIYMSSREKHDSVMAGHTEDAKLDNSRASIGMNEGHVLLENGDDLQKHIGSVQSVEESASLDFSAVEESTIPDNRGDQMELVEDPLKHSLSTMSEIEIDDSHPSSPRSQTDMVPRDELEDPSVMCPDTDTKGSSLHASESNQTDGNVEESTVTMEVQGGRRTRSLTLEEATDTILFCSSIVHDLAYKAASIAIEKEKENLEPLPGSRPTITIPERHSSNKKELPGIPTGRTKKAPKARKRLAETEENPPLTKNDERPSGEPLEPVVRNVGLPNNGDSMKPPKLESKCNCTIM